MNSIYNVEYLNKKGKIETLEKYKNKIIIIVNTASKCGLVGQFEELENLYKEYKDDLIIIGFPSDDFKQELKNDGAEEFCRLNYGVTFPIAKQVHVRGKESAEIFKYLTSQKKGFITKGIKWNFTKFLIDQNGKVVKRYAPKTNPLKMKREIDNLLK